MPVKHRAIAAAMVFRRRINPRQMFSLIPAFDGVFLLHQRGKACWFGDIVYNSNT
jgi:hypothetical protein